MFREAATRPVVSAPRAGGTRRRAATAMSAASGGVWCAARVSWAGRPRARRGERAARAFRVRAGADVASDSSAEKCPPLRNLLGAADDKAWAHVLSSPEGRELSCLPLRVVSMRMLRLRDALAAVRDLDVAAMAIEQPGLLLFDGDWEAEVPRVWNAVERALGPDVRLARLADACPCAFAIVLRRSMTMEGDHFPEEALVKRLGAPSPSGSEAPTRRTGSASSPAAWAASGGTSTPWNPTPRRPSRAPRSTRFDREARTRPRTNNYGRRRHTSEPPWLAAQPPRPRDASDKSARRGENVPSVSLDDEGARDRSRYHTSLIVYE